MNQIGAMLQREGRLAQKLGRSSEKKQSRERKNGVALASVPQEGMLPKFTRTPGKIDGPFVCPHDHVIALRRDFQANCCHLKAFPS